MKSKEEVLFNLLIFTSQWNIKMTKNTAREIVDSIIEGLDGYDLNYDLIYKEITQTWGQGQPVIKDEIVPKIIKKTLDINYNL